MKKFLKIVIFIMCSIVMVSCNHEDIRTHTYEISLNNGKTDTVKAVHIYLENDRYKKVYNFYGSTNYNEIIAIYNYYDVMKVRLIED